MELSKSTRVVLVKEDSRKLPTIARCVRVGPSEPGSDNEPVIRCVDHPNRDASFGFASDVYELGDLGGRSRVRLSLPVAPELVSARQLDAGKLRLFYWNRDAGTFNLVRGSGPEPDGKHVSGEVREPGLYTVIGLSNNPWIAHTVDLLRQHAPFLAQDDLRESLREKICGLTLSDAAWRKALNANGRADRLGVPPVPDGIGDLCRNLPLPDGRLPEFDILEESNPENRSRLFYFLDQWLTANLAVAHTIVWRAPGIENGAPKPYPRWRRSEKAQLSKAFWNAMFGTSFNLPVTPDVHLLTAGSEGAIYGTVLDEELAWEYYIGYVAQSLAAELGHKVPWSLLDYSNEELRWLFDSKSLFEYRAEHDGYVIVHISEHPNYPVNHGAVTPSDPVDTYKWLLENIPLGATRLDTIVRILRWCQRNLSHSVGGSTPVLNEAHWQYEGWAPVLRILEGTTLKLSEFRTRFGHWTYGCRGTTGLLRAVLRTINIPTALRERCGHALPHFLHDQRYLSHGDDPYALSREVDAGELLIDEARFQMWFGDRVSEQGHCNNIGRQVVELELEHLPTELLEIHCDDVENGRNRAASRVLERYARNYDLQALEEKRLWERLDEKVEELGGCAALGGE